MSALRSEVDEWEAQPPHPGAQPQPAVLAEDGLDWTGYAVDGGEVSACRFVLTREHPLGLIATQITMTGRGPRARVQVWWGRIRLAWAGLLLDDPRERHHLAECAWERLHPSLALIYPRAQLGRDLDHFCFGLWEAWTEANQASPSIEESPAQHVAQQAQQPNPPVQGFDIPRL
jgi:hypothetical protein